MSVKHLSNKIEKTCEGCGSVHEYEFVGINETTIKELQDWYTVVREIFFNGEFHKIAVQACSLACVPVAAVKLALPPAPEEPDNIDLASLRTPEIIN